MINTRDDFKCSCRHPECTDCHPRQPITVYLLWMLESGIERLHGIYSSQDLADHALAKRKGKLGRTEPRTVIIEK